MQELNPSLTIIDKEVNSVGISSYAGSQIEKCPSHGFKICIKQTSDTNFQEMLPDVYVRGFTSKEGAQKALKTIAESINKDSVVDLSNTDENITPNNQTKIFIGHGRSHVWRELKDFIEDTLGLEYEEFNRISPAGKAHQGPP